MIKVLHLIHGLSIGGAETLVKNYMLNFDFSKLDVTLLCLRHESGSPYEQILKDRGVKVVYVEDYLLFKKLSNVVAKALNRVNEYLIVKRLIRNENPDIIHFHLPMSSYVKFAKPKKETILFHTVHSEPNKLWSGKDYDFAAAKWLIKNRNLRFIVLHERMREEINKMFGISDSIILNNGVDVEGIQNARSGKDVREELGVLGGAFVLGHIGRFSEVKNQNFLVDVFIEVVKKNKKAFLLMVGEGPDKDRIMEKLNENSLEGNFLILSNRDDMPDLFKVIDVFVLPSLYEGLPLSLIEAQIAGKPCFISDEINEYSDISNLIIRLSLKRDAKEWADAILSYKKPKKIVVSKDDWDIRKVTKKLEEIYLDAFIEGQNGKK